jgi:hypothetical protein
MRSGIRCSIGTSASMMLIQMHHDEYRRIEGGR